MARFIPPRTRASRALALLVGCGLGILPAAAEGPPASEGVETLDPKKAAKLVVKREVPEYPPLAKVNFIQGPVRMMVKVSAQGQVSEAHVVIGHPFLAVAALRAFSPPLRTTTGPTGSSSCLRTGPRVDDVSIPRRKRRTKGRAAPGVGRT